MRTTRNFGSAVWVVVLCYSHFSISIHGIVQALSTKNPPPEVFPVSTRQLLSQKSKNLGFSSYSSGWSNRVGSVLTPVSIPGIYTADRPFYWNGIDVGCRMTLIELSSGAVFIHSPVILDGPLQRTLQEQFPNITYIVSPNYEHVKYAAQWAQAYPNAELWACPGLMERESSTRWTGEIPYSTRPTNTKNTLPWNNDELQALHIDCEVNPFTNKPFFNEVVFFHVPSKTLLVTDLYWNYPTSTTNADIPNNGPWELAPSMESIPLGSQLWKFGMDKLFQPFYMNLMIQQKQRFRDEIVHILLEEWDIETVVPAHGDIIRGKEVIRSVLRKHFNLNQ